MTRRSDPNCIMFILSRYGVGGAEKQLANLILHRPQSALAMDVRTITLLPTSSIEVETRFEGAGVMNTLVDRSRHSFPAFFIQLIRAIRELRPVLISTILDSSAGTWGRLAAVLTGVPIIVHSSRQLINEDTVAHSLLSSYLNKRTKRFLPNATAIADRLAAEGVPRSKIMVVPNGVDLEVFDPVSASNMRASLGIPVDAVVLGYLGRFAPSKRVDLLIEALLQLDVQDRPDFVILAGDGPAMAMVREMVMKEPWLNDSCKFLGTIDDTPSFLATIDYLVLPTESEGLPNVILEAMAMNKPVISTRVSDIPTLIDNAGFIAEPSEAGSLTDAILAMQTLGPAGRKKLGDRARLRVEHDYSIKVASRRFWNAHTDLIKTYLEARLQQ